MILDKFRLDGQVAVVTGSSRGMGCAVALGFAQAGADVAAVSRTANPDLERAIKELGRRYIFHQADLTKRDQTKRVIPAVVDQLGGVDILVNNAGIIRRAVPVDYSEEDWDDTLEIDLSSAFILSKAAAVHMLKNGGGKIVNVASVLAFQGGLNVSAYVAAKHGLAGLTKALCNHWAGQGINVNAIAPGWIKTELTQNIQNDPKRYESLLARTPAGRWGEPEDIVGAALFLASQASDFVHGTTIVVDGGWLSW